MSRDYMVERSSGLAAISALAAPHFVNCGPEPSFGFPAANEVNAINPRLHPVFPDKIILGRIRDAKRLQSQMATGNYHQQTGVSFTSFNGGYFRAWYNYGGMIHYLPDCYDTRSAAESAAERCLEEAKCV
jgi:hypothetical protein